MPENSVGRSFHLISLLIVNKLYSYVFFCYSGRLVSSLSADGR